MRQWRHFFEVEFAPVAAAFARHYHSTSNHNLYDLQSAVAWRKVFAWLPQNGPKGQEGLAYWARDDNLLLVVTNTPGFPPREGAHLEWQWLDEALSAHADAAIKIVVGHHPVHPVNGYDRHPMWCPSPDERHAFWDVLVRHEVLAYICSHVIAYDVQVHQDVLQLCTAGAGTQYGPGGAMPGATEYLHFVECVASHGRLAAQTRDVDGRVREWLDWPLQLPADHQWSRLDPSRGDGAAPSHSPLGDGLDMDVVAWRIRGTSAGHRTLQDQVLVCGTELFDAAPRILIALAGGTARVTVALAAEPAANPQIWLGPPIAPGTAFDMTIALHPGMGPGGCLLRLGSDGPWTSLATSTSTGPGSLTWPKDWTVGHGPNGPDDRPFSGGMLAVDVVTVPLRYAQRRAAPMLAGSAG